MTLYPQMIIEALQTVTYAGTKKNLIESEMLADQPVVAAPEKRGRAMACQCRTGVPS